MDDTAFTRIDAKLFQRLHWGSLAPLTFHMRDGRKVTGQVLAISRQGASGVPDTEPVGTVWVSDQGGRCALAYDMIIEID